MMLEKAHALQDGLISFATGDYSLEDASYKMMRLELIKAPNLSDKIPEFLRRCTSIDHFWQFIKGEHATYAARREYIWNEFSPLINFLENQESSPADEGIASSLQNLNSDSVHSVWQKALDRRNSDPEGAITIARSLLETVCKHILDDSGVSYKSSDDLPKLYRTCATSMNLSPSQHSEQAFKAILGGCHTIVQYLGTLRNQVSDAHGRGRRAIKPKPRHAELAVNVSGAMAAFLVETWQEQSKR
ncbi:abortive infection family protein [Tunicatimonas pelagia]|uniref:abortive infection family protein n=1 Tax=Tunicatimonas pelagia TaxID=931531 RepID=UPI002665E484|nr:abortive infection family protein [Tunicatimonas pelagia]WKN44237.1 abortive infection family protein [Tunicatimonas pelagia]